MLLESFFIKIIMARGRVPSCFTKEQWENMTEAECAEYRRKRNLEKVKKWNEKNKDKVQQKQREYYKRHKGDFAEHNKKYHSSKQKEKDDLNKICKKQQLKLNLYEQKFGKINTPDSSPNAKIPSTTSLPTYLNGATEEIVFASPLSLPNSDDSSKSCQKVTLTNRVN